MWRMCWRCFPPLAAVVRNECLASQNNFTRFAFIFGFAHYFSNPK